MSDAVRLGACAAISIVAHFALTEGLRSLPPHQDEPPPQKITIRVVEPPPEPPPEPPKPPEVAPVPAPVVTPQVAQITPHPKQQQQPKQVPQPPKIVAEEETPGPRGIGTGSGTPIRGITMSSTSQGGNGPVMQTGNGGSGPDATNGPASDDKPAGGGHAAPVPDYSATKKPLPQGRCTGKYNDEAKKAGVEGVVILDVTVSADGSPSNITVVQGLPHGLTKAAIAALSACKFTPGEVNGKAVAVRIHAFKITFYLQDSE